MLAMTRNSVLAVLAVLLLAPVAVAQTNRSAVSVTGNDAATCTVPDPCRTFTVALSQTNPGGEVLALTSGGYGPFVIDRPVAIVAAPGIYAALVATSGNAITVNAGVTAKVVIRGLHLYGMGTGNDGIGVTGSSDEVHIENCVIDGFAGSGILAFLNVRVSDTTIRNCGRGIDIDNAGAVVKGTINRVKVRDTSSTGIRSYRNANVTVRDSVVAGCGNGFSATFGTLNIENSLATNNLSAGVAAASGGTVRASNTMATDNGVGFSNAVASTFISWGNNKVRGNTTDTSGTITVVPQD